MKERELNGYKIGISVSECKDMRNRGFTERDMNLLTVELCRRLVSLGATVILGHQWRPRGIMEGIAAFAQVYRDESARPPQPIIYNKLAHPNRTALSDRDRSDLKGILDVEDNIEDTTLVKHPFIEKRTGDLTFMRRKISSLMDARIALGGKTEQKSGFVHGVLEEVMLGIEDKKPVYVSGLLGGTCSVLIKTLREKVAPPSFREPAPQNPWDQLRNETADPNPKLHKYAAGWSELGTERLADLCGFESVEQLDQLFDAQNLDTVIELVVGALRARKRAGHLST